MAKIVSLATISTEFGIDPNVMESLGIIDTQLTADTNLFIDPLLLIDSEHQEMNTAAATAYEQRFEFIVKLLAASRCAEMFHGEMSRNYLTSLKLAGHALVTVRQFAGQALARS